MPKTIATRLADEGVGLPAVWEYAPNCWAAPLSYPRDTSIDLVVPTNYRECLAQLARWSGEDGRGVYWLKWDPRSKLWGLWVANTISAGAIAREFPFVPEPQNGVLREDSSREALAAILAWIGRDHAIRRDMDWPVDAGTLVSLDRTLYNDGWELCVGNSACVWSGDCTAIEAHESLYRSVCESDGGE